MKFSDIGKKVSHYDGISWLLLFWVSLVICACMMMEGGCDSRTSHITGHIDLKKLETQASPPILLLPWATIVRGEKVAFLLAR